MPKRDPDLLVGDIRACLRQVAEYIRGMDLDAFRSDRKTIDAVTRNLEIIGEAARQLTEADRAVYPEIPWQRIVGLRHRIVHDYFGIDTELIWEIASKDAPELAHLLEGRTS
ncbi:MAG: DUF86 domain-containing protein [Chthoniobacterales bacterium]|nr:DUF86 domain-containing protein [Chthoniobacterales bacterium]